MSDKPNNLSEKKGGSALSIIGIVLGVIAIIFSFIPVINVFACVLGIIAAIFGIIAIICKQGGKAIVALVLGALAVVITLAVNATWSEAVNDAVDNLNSSLDDMSGANTETLLAEAVDVEIGEFTVSTSDYGWQSTSLEVTITNRLEEAKSYSVQIEAVDADGNRLDSTTVYVSSLGSGQSQTQEIFTYVSSDDIEAMQAATFQIVSVSAY